MSNKRPPAPSVRRRAAPTNRARMGVKRKSKQRMGARRKRTAIQRIGAY